MLTFVPITETPHAVSWTIFSLTAVAVAISLGAEHAARRRERSTPWGRRLRTVSRKAAVASMIGGAVGMFIYTHSIINGILAVTMYIVTLLILVRVTQTS